MLAFHHSVAIQVFCHTIFQQAHENFIWKKAMMIRRYCRLTAFALLACTPLVSNAAQTGTVDLVPQITSPSSARPGNYHTVRIVEFNRGTRPSGVHRIEILLSGISLADGVINAPSIMPGNRIILVKRILISPLQARGDYRLCVKTDADNRIRESNERNNTVCQPLRLQNPRVTRRLPDLTVYFNRAPNTVTSGRSFQTMLYDHNIGNFEAQPHRLLFELRRSNRVIARLTTQDAVRLLAGMKRRYTITHRVPASVPAGRYQLCAITDAERRIRESNERNNQDCLPIQVITLNRRVSRPDLTIRSLMLPGIMRQGQRLMVYIGNYNQGRGAAPRHQIRYVLQRANAAGGYTRYAILGTLPAVGMYPRRFYRLRHFLRLPARIPAGTYKLCATLDPDNRVRESNEANNTACRNFRVR